MTQKPFVSTKVNFRWFGDDVTQMLLEATKDSVEETFVACVQSAKPNTPYVTGTLEGSIGYRPNELEIKDNAVTGTWGSYDVEYALAVEKGTRGQPGRNMLQNAAALEYPKLRGRIRDKVKEQT